MTEGLTTEQRAIIDEEVAAERARPGSLDPQVPGCLVAFVGMALLTLTPPASGWIEVPQPVATGALAVGAILLFAGALIPFLVGLIRGGSDELRACRESAQALEAWGRTGDPDPTTTDPAVLGAAVRLILNAYTVRGPSTTMTPGFDRLDADLKPARPLLCAVEAYLLADGRAYPVFTNPSGGGRLPG